MTHKVPLIVRIDADLRARVKALAKKSNRTINNYVETLLLRDMGLELPITKGEEEAANMAFPT